MRNYPELVAYYDIRPENVMGLFDQSRANTGAIEKKRNKTAIRYEQINYSTITKCRFVFLIQPADVVIHGHSAYL